MAARAGRPPARWSSARLRRRARGNDASTASGTKHQRREAPGADVPQPQRPDQPVFQPFLSHRREGEAFGGAHVRRAAGMAIGAKAGIEQRFTRNDVRGTLRTDHERGSVGVTATGVLREAVMARQSSLPTAWLRPAAALSANSHMKGMGAGGPAPDSLAPSPACGGGGLGWGLCADLPRGETRLRCGRSAGGREAV